MPASSQVVALVKACFLFGHPGASSGVCCWLSRGLRGSDVDVRLGAFDKCLSSS